MEKTYYAYKRKWDEMETFAILPLVNGTPYVDGVYDPVKGIFYIVTNVEKEGFDMIPKVDEYGNPFPNRHNPKQVKQERVRIKTFHEHMLVGDDIKWFLTNLVMNGKEYIKMLEPRPELTLEPA